MSYNSEFYWKTMKPKQENSLHILIFNFLRITPAGV
jgi:hypothetical protein